MPIATPSPRRRRLGPISTADRPAIANPSRFCTDGIEGRIMKKARTAKSKKTPVARKVRSASKQPVRVPDATREDTTGAAARDTATSAAPASSGGYRAKVRMYRQGLGDCFLVSLKRSGDAPDYKILIDCGVILGTADPGTIMTKVVDDIVATTGGKVDLLLATHEHWDHLSGFIQAAESFKRLTVGEVWLAWTEDPADPLATELRGERNQAMAALQMAANTLRMTNSRSLGPDGIAAADIISDMLGFFGAAGSGTTSDALDKVKAMGPVRYCRPKDAPTELGDPSARLFVLGPPPDAKLIRRTLPSKNSPETYRLAMDGDGVMPADVHKALASEDDDLPFSPMYAIPTDIARGMEFYRRYYWGPGDEAPAWRSIDSDWVDSAPELALALDSATNNTSLVLAIELAGGDVLLFVADAQVGNWESWHDLAWTIDGKTVTGPDLLSRTIFYKVGHHGSHNATLREKGLEQMEKLRVAMLPVDQAMAKKKHWDHMPLDELVSELNKKAKGVVLRVDQPMPTTQEQVVEDRLFFEVAF